jgi:alkylhydroperoxidase family enzyme
VETGYLPKTSLSEFDGFLPHLKRINHRYPLFELTIGLVAAGRELNLTAQLAALQQLRVSGRLVADDCANTVRALAKVSGWCS